SVRLENVAHLLRAWRRWLGKYTELAFGFGGSVGAWRKIVGDDGRSDKKDPEARKAMHRLSRPPSAKKRKKPEDRKPESANGLRKPWRGMMKHGVEWGLVATGPWGFG